MKEIQELYEQYGKRLYNYFYYLTCDLHQADDLTQETFFRAVLSIPRFKGASSLSTWLFAIGRNVYLKSIRKKGIKMVALSSEDLEDLPASEESSPENMIIRAESMQNAEFIISRMPAQYASALLLRDKEGFSYGEIARITGDSLASVKVNIHRARKKFREEYDKCEEKQER